MIDRDVVNARLEAIVWPHGPVGPKCGNVDGKRIYSIKGKTARPACAPVASVASSLR